MTNLPTYQTKLENQRQLEKFIPRPYQMDALNALFGAGPYQGQQKDKLYLCWSRGAGKDIFCFMAMVRKALVSRPGQYFYLLPTGRQARLVMWDTVLTHNGLSFRDMIPKALVRKVNDTKMLIELVNGSLIHILGSNEASEKLVGANPSGIVFSETQVSNLPEAFDYVRPRLVLNHGWAIFNGTPRGMSNYFYQLYNIAKNDPEDWFYSYKTCYDTQHLDPVLLAKTKKDMSPDKFAQEFECDFSVGQAGCYWGKEIDKMRLEERITSITYEPNYLTWCAVDLGVSDPSCFIFFQVIGNVINIIDYEEHTDKGLDFYAKMCDEKGYKYGGFFFPHDIAVREIGAIGAASRLETATNLGFKVNVVPSISVDEGIEAVRMILPRVWINEKKCQKLIAGLESYHRVFDEERKTYRERPEHDWASHPADAMRMLALSLHHCVTGTSPEEITKMYNQARYGNNSNIPPVFQDRFRY